MREILFRGQTRRYGEKVNMAGEKLPSKWVFGSAMPGPGDYSIIYDENLDKHSVYSDTVGEYTGVLDKNHEKIFEGDIVKYLWVGIGFEESYVKFRIDFITGEFIAVPIENQKKVWSLRISGLGEELEKIGNIYDNPELLGGC